MQGNNLLTLKSNINNSAICFSLSSDLSEWHCKKSVLALVDGEVWDMYRPLTKSCEIQFLTFKDEDPEEVNKVNFHLNLIAGDPKCSSLILYTPFSSMSICLLELHCWLL